MLLQVVEETHFVRSWQTSHQARFTVQHDQITNSAGAVLGACARTQRSWARSHWACRRQTTPLLPHDRATDFGANVAPSRAATLMRTIGRAMVRRQGRQIVFQQCKSHAIFLDQTHGMRPSSCARISMPMTTSASVMPPETANIRASRAMSKTPNETESRPN